MAQIPENDEEVDYKQIAVDAAEADIDDAKDQLAHALAHYNAKKALLGEEELRFKLVEEFETLGKSTWEVEFARADRTEMMMRAPPLAMATVQLGFDEDDEGNDPPRNPPRAFPEGAETEDDIHFLDHYEVNMAAVRLRRLRHGSGVAYFSLVAERLDRAGQLAAAEVAVAAAKKASSKAAAARYAAEEKVRSSRGAQPL